MAAREHDLEVIATILDGAGSVLVRADDPETVARAVAAGLDARLVAIDELPEAVADARHHAELADQAPADLDRLTTLVGRVRAAERLVAGTVAHEEDRAAALDPDPGPHADAPAPGPTSAADGAEPQTDGSDADRQTVRFALVILVLAQLGGLAVFVAAGDLLAPAVPAVALVGLAAVVLRHRKPASVDVGGSATPAALAAAAPSPPIHVPPSAAVRAAEAHLRRQRAAWKVAWWEQGREPPSTSSWSPEPIPHRTWTLVAVDGTGALDDPAFTSLTATLPDAVRVVVVSSPPG